ncbi:MAG: toll/interleukin-1 receptor domain-containing protein [Woeseiaceae bacterium]|nr:toll/interleukin-1 receptor domain-containing protein [Woeseiaceae bacterium]
MTGYDGFISYAHAHDRVISEALERQLRRFGRKWNRPWAVRIFRDDSNLAVAPDLWDGVKTALLDSRFLILLACPDSARSKWVAREIEAFVDHRGPDNILILLTDGEIVWDEQTADFDWSATTAVPEALAGRLTQEPKYLDLRWAADDPQLERGNPRWIDAIAELSAVLQGKPKDELCGEDARQRRKQRAVLVSAIGAMVLAPLLVIGFSALVSTSVQQDASEQIKQQRERGSRRTQAIIQAEAALDSGDLDRAIDLYRSAKWSGGFEESRIIGDRLDRLIENALADNSHFEVDSWKAAYYELYEGDRWLKSAGQTVGHKIKWRVEHMREYLADQISGYHARAAPENIRRYPSLEELEQIVSSQPGQKVTFGSLLGTWHVVASGAMRKSGFAEYKSQSKCVVSVNNGEVRFQLRDNGISSPYVLSRATSNTLYAKHVDSSRGWVMPGAIIMREFGEFVFIGFGRYEIRERVGQPDEKYVYGPGDFIFSVTVCRRWQVPKWRQPRAAKKSLLGGAVWRGLQTHLLEGVPFN